MTEVLGSPEFLISVAVEQACSIYGKPFKDIPFKQLTLGEIDFIMKWKDFAYDFPTDYGYILH